MHKRKLADDHILVALNIVNEPRKLHYEGRGRLLLSTYLDERKTVGSPLHLRPDEGVIIKF
jgi:alpha-glucosidase